MKHTLHHEIVQASYSAQRITRYQGNPLIEALPVSQTDDELIESLTLLPEFDSEQRSWATHERMHQLFGLKNFMVPLASHIALARSMDSMMREGYVGRAPRTPEHVRIFQHIYERQKAGSAFRQTPATVTAQLSSSLIGLSGVGKTTTVKRQLAHIPQVIFHPELDLYQVPYLRIEMPSDGQSIKGLAAAILHKLDELIPDQTYYETYYGSGRVGADALMRSVARVMNMHLVGLLICDELQNLTNSRKGAQTVMTELVSACNDLRVPILFIGTNKAARLLGLDFRQARRAVGPGATHWSNLPERSTEGEPNEWAGFIEVLWQFQWVRNPIPLTPHLLSVVYHYTQGIIDLAIKLFAGAQARAMADGSERLSAQLLAEVYNEDMKLIHPMVEALRSNDLGALQAFEDIAPLTIEGLVNNMSRRLTARRNSAALAKPGDAGFVPQLAAAGMAMGLNRDLALEAAEIVESDGTAANMLEATKQLVGKVSPPKRVASRGRDRKKGAAPAIDFSARPFDYRRAANDAKLAGTGVLDELRRLGMARPAEELITIE